MDGFKTIGDQRYINSLFNTLARQKEIPVSVHIGTGKDSYYASLAFNNKKENEPHIIFENQELKIGLSEKVKVFFFFKESFFFFESVIIGFINDFYQLKRPHQLYLSTKRMMPRYKFAGNEDVYISFSEQPADYRLYDLSINGLSFFSDDKLPVKGQTLRNITLKLEDHIELVVDITIKHFRKNNNGKYIYGAAFLTMEWFTSNEIFSYIFEKSYPDLKLLHTLSTREIFKLYKESRYISLKSKEDRERSFIAQIRKLDNCNRNPVLGTGAVYFKNGKLLTIGSAFRVYNRSFVGQPFTTVPGTWINPKGKIDLYIGLAEATLNHPYMEYFFSYITSDLDWHQITFNNIDKIINDQDLFNFNLIPYFECEIAGLTNEKAESSQSARAIRCEELTNPNEFIAHCHTGANAITTLECNCYKYEPENFYLSELKQFYQEMGFFIDRKLWRITEGAVRPRTVAYIVAEIYSEGLSINNELDICRIFLVDQQNAFTDINEILKVLLPDVSTFYQENGKEKFIIFFNAKDQIMEINIPGLRYQSLLGRVMMNRTGLSEFRKLLLVTSEFHGKYFPLTHPQKLIWFSEKVFPGTSIGNNAGTLRLKGELDFRLLEEAVNIFLEKNDTMRLRILEECNEPRQYIAEYNYYYPEIFDFSKSKGFNDFYKWEEVTTNIPFALINADLFYFAFIRISNQETAFYFNVHHTITDGWSMNMILSQIFKYYCELKKGLPVSEEKRPSYIEYITSEEEFEHSGKYKKYKRYWDEKYATIPEFIYFKNKRPGNYNTKTKRKGFVIDSQTTTKINEYCSEHKESLFTFFLAIISVYINRIFMKADLSIGTTTLNRSDVREKASLGMFVNVIPIRLFVDSNLSFETYIQTIGSEWKSVLKNQKYPYDLILKDFRERHRVQDDLYDIMFTYRNAKLDIAQDIGEYKVRSHTCGHQNHSLTIFIDDRQGEGNYIISIDYLVEFFEEEEIKQIFNCLLNLLKDLLQHPSKMIYQLEMLPEADRKRLLLDFNNTKSDYAREKTINRLFEEQVEKSPDKIALVFSDKQLTYRELNERSNQLARVLRVKGIKPDTLVGIMVDRSFEMIIGIMGILKAGGAYLPISPEYPDERIEFIIQDSNARILLTQKSLKNKILLTDEILDIQDSELYKGDKSNIESVNTSKDLIYVLFTSGSTGKPKGVMIEHQSVLNILTFLEQEYPVLDADAYLLKTTFTFDVSVTELFGWFFGSGRLVILEKGAEKDPERILKSIHKYNITHINFAPSLLNVFINSLKSEEINSLNSLKYVFVAGEALSQETVSSFYGLVKHIKLENLYGPTEATIYATKYSLKDDSTVTIGKPVQNTTIFIVDKNNNLQPVGIPGELCIAGDGLARGYWNRKELTDEKFVPNPFSPGELMYKTSDLVRWLEDGNIEFFGRLDFQVKIRGYRIELGEIEHQLLENEFIREAVVIAKEDSNKTKYLCAYFTAVKELTDAELRLYLLKRLPEYMIPSFLMQLDKLPLSINGKINRNALPEPTKVEKEREYTAPRNKTEEILKNVWEQVLGVKKIGIHNTFYELGGDSIKAIQVSSSLRKYGITFELQDLLKYPSIAAISNYIKIAGERKTSEIVEGKVSLTPIQKWFFEQDRSQIHYFNQSVILYDEKGFNKAIIERVFTKIVEYHDALRIVYKNITSIPIQINRGLEGNFFDLLEFDFSDHLNSWDLMMEKTNQLQNSIDLIEGPLVKLGLFKTMEGDYLVIIIHHLVVDGVSWRILLDDFANSYLQAINEEEITYPEKTSSYQEWADKLRLYAEDKKLLRELQYWEEIENTSVNPLPKDSKITENRVMDSCDLQLTLTEEDTRKLTTETNKAFNTNIYEVLLTVLGLTLKEWAGENKFLINLEGHGRENIIEGIDLSRTVGWFTSLFPFIMDMSSTDLSYQIRFIKESLRRIPNKGIGYGILKYLNPEINAERKKLVSKPELCFNYLGQINNVKNEVFTISQFFSINMLSPYAQRRYVLDINALIINDTLTINFNYNKNEYLEHSMTRFIKLFQERLLKTIDYCSSQTQTKFSPADFGETNLEIEELEKITELYGDKIEKIYGLTPLQEGMLFHSMLNMNSTVYFEQASFNLGGKLDLLLFEKSLHSLVERHEVLRTVFYHLAVKTPKQIVLKTAPAKIYFEDITFMGEQQQISALENFEKHDREKGFDLSIGPLLRVSILRMRARAGEESFRLILSFHHIILDGWSLGLIFKEWFEIYQTLREGLELNLAEIRPFGDFVRWLEKADQEEASNYWRNCLASFETPTGLPKSKSNSINDKFEPGEIEFKLGEVLTKDLVEMAQTNQVTLNTVFSVVWGLLLCRYNNADTAVFGSVTSVRPVEVSGIQNMAGLFINTIPTMIKVGGNQNFMSLLKQTQRSILASEKYNYFPLGRIQQNTGLKQELLDHIIAFENYPLEDEMKNLIYDSKFLDFKISNLKVFEHTNYNLNIIVTPGKELSVKLNYNAPVFEEYILKNIGVHINTIIKTVTENPGITIKDIPILSAAEKRLIMDEFNNTGIEYPRDKTIQELFFEQAQKCPTDIAVVFENKKITYRELNEKSNQLAAILKKKGVAPNIAVGLMAKQSLETIIGILAILKAGGAYLPIDHRYPPERVEYILKDSGTFILLTQDQLLKQVHNFTGDVLHLEDETLYQGSGANLEILNNPVDMAYIMYTSGSTGKPKGVMVLHRGVVRLVKNPNYISFEKNDRILQTGSFSFDASTFEIWGALLNGLCLYLIPEESILNIEKLRNAIVSNQITILWLTSSLFNLIAGQNPGLFATLKYLLVGGDVLSPKYINLVRSIHPALKIINGYGPTENTTFSTCFVIDKSYEENIPIGKPLSNSTAYILDNFLNIQPVGIGGELCVGGDGLAKGYLNNPELTREKFIPNPFVGVDASVGASQGTGLQRIYRTGDLARWLPDGSIEFLGRIDNQIKIRGFRVELGEIETYLANHEQIKAVTVIDKKDANGNKYLCAYIVSDKDLTAAELRNYLADKLPEYMIPATFIQIKQMPLNANGKVDRKALPEPNQDIIMIKNKDNERPVREIEKEMAAIWQKVLGSGVVGINDNFFELGGNSLVIMRVLAEAFSYNWNLSIQDFYEYQTIKELADKILGLIDHENDSIINDIIVKDTRNDFPEILSTQQETGEFENVLLTGATGFFGIHVLDKLITQTNANVYCLIRGENKSIAKERLVRLLNFYFLGKYDETIFNRVFVVNGDLIYENFGLSKSDYNALTDIIDTVIHTAALVKHFGEYSEFERINVFGAREVIKFCMAGGSKLNHISTISVSGDGLKQPRPGLKFTENDLYIGQNYIDSVYIKSKFEAEKLVFKANSEGLNTTIFRLGNLTERYTDGQFQWDINENKFHNILKALIDLGIAPDIILDEYIELTPVDFCSEAAIKLMQSKMSSGKVFHLYNHKMIKLGYLFELFKKMEINMEVQIGSSYQKYIEYLLKHKKEKEEAITIIINEFNFDEVVNPEYRVNVATNITRRYLKLVDFDWPEINFEYVKKMIDYMQRVGSVDLRQKMQL